jgi:site-specific DNA recombinase
MCTPHAVRLNELINTVAGEIKNLIYAVLNEDSEKYLSDRVNGIIVAENKIETKTKELSKISKTIQDNKKALSDTYLDKSKNLISEEEYITLRETFNDTIRKELERYERLKSEIELIKMADVEKPDAITLAKQYADFEELTTEIVTQFIDYIEVGEKDMYNNQDINIHWNI